MDRHDVARPRLGVLAWTQWDRTLAYLTVGAAGVLFATGTYQLAHSPYGAEEVTHLISGGLGALALVGVAVTVLFVADLRDHHHKLNRLERAAQGRPLADPRGLLLRLAGAAPVPAEGLVADQPGATLSWRHGAVWTAVFLAGVILLGAGWRTASTTPDRDRALEGLALASAGLGLVAVALAGTVMTLRRRISRRSVEVLGAVARIAGRSQTAVLALPKEQVAPDMAWTAPGLERYHRRDCPALHSRTGEPYLVSVPDVALAPCLLCHQEGPSDE